MLTYNMDVEERSTWLRATPGAAALAQPFYCTEAGNFYGRAHFATARTDKESYLLFYTLSGSGLIEQNDRQRPAVARPHPAKLLHCPRAGPLAPLLGASGRRGRRQSGRGTAAAGAAVPRYGQSAGDAAAV